MKHKVSIGTYILILCALSFEFFLITGCGESANVSTFGSSTPAPPLPGTSNGLLNDLDYFYVGVDTTKEAIAHVHSTAGFSSNCGVSKDSTTNEDIVCIIEVPEADLYAKTLELKYNVPAGMCRYLQRGIYWFYNHEVGFGPETININILNTVNGSGVITNTDYNCTIDGVADGAPNNSCLGVTSGLVTEAVNTERTPQSVKYRCAYDNSDSKNGKNCCFGDYVLNTTTKTGVEPAYTTSEKLSWGGNLKDCIGGPGKTDWTHYTTEGLPIWELIFAKNGITEHQNVTAPIDLKIRTNIHTSNYYGGTASSPVDHTHTGFIDNVTTSTAPYFIDPIDDRDGTPISSTQESYEFQCLDEAFEIQHRIRVYVRDWDTYPDYLTYIDSEGAIVTPDRGDIAEPASNCESIPYAGYSCNDFHDIDDFLTLDLNIGNYNTTPGNAMNRGSYFPSFKY